MCAKSKRSSPWSKPKTLQEKPTTAAKVKAKATKEGLDRPFSAAILKQAQAAARDYQIVLTNESGHWYGRGLELPLVFGDGATPAKCIEDTQAAMRAAVAYLLEQGQSPPAAARLGKRTQQVNVRLTAEEKAALEAAAHCKGFEGLSDFMRAAALERSRS